MENKKLEKILVINDNAEDVAELRKFLPSYLKIKEMSQFEGSLAKRFDQYDLMQIADNILGRENGKKK
ncbi:MAG: hypothetical protein QW041_02875 [Candidatus Pacearchaeota archaeon]